MLINFVSGGKLGDFIHCMYAVKNLCRKHGEGTYADVYIADGMGDIWSKGLNTAYDDLYELISTQPYVNGFNIINGFSPKECVDLNTWRVRVANIHSETGRYTMSWSELLSTEFRFDIPKEYAWLKCYKRNFDAENCIVISNSVGHGGGLPLERIFDMACKEFLFLTSNFEEWELFKFKDKAKLYYVDSIYDMASVINSCRLFVGNQSAPLALASALDVPRIGNLNPDPSPFYMGEEKYTDNFMWYLNDKVNYIKF